MRVLTDRETFRSTARAAVDGRVPVEVRMRVADPFEAYRRARRGDGGDIFLETTGGQSGWGYFATDPTERITVGPDAVSLAGGSPSLEAIDAALADESLERGGCETPYPCGVFGWLSYDIARELESLPERTVDDRGLPRLQLAKYDRVAAWKEPHANEATLRITACPRLSDHESIDSAYDHGLRRARELVAHIVSGDRSVGRGPAAGERATFEPERVEKRHPVFVRQVVEPSDDIPLEPCEQREQRRPGVYRVWVPLGGVRRCPPAQTILDFLATPPVDCRVFDHRHPSCT